MLKIFKTGAKNLFLTIFAAAIMAAGFWSAVARDAKASPCGVDCYKSSGDCYIDDTVWSATANKVCTINNLTEKNNASGTNSCVGSNGACQQDACPNVSSFNGSPCYIKFLPTSCSTYFTDSSTTAATGFWNATEKRCIGCVSGKENQIFGDISSITTKDGDKKFNLACSGVSAECKDQIQGCVNSNAGFCNSSGAYTSCPSNNCSGGACPVAVVCTHQNPTVSIVGNSSQTKSAGDTATYSISVANTDSAISCAGSTNFNLTLSGCPSGWTCSIASSLSVQAGFSNSTSLTITSPASATPGTSNVIVTASGNSKSGNTTATYVIAAGLNVSSNKNIIFAGSSTSVIFTVIDGSGPVSGAAVSYSGAASGSCSSNTNSSGKCSVNITPGSAGTITVEALYGTDSANTPITVNAAPCTDGTCGGATVAFDNTCYQKTEFTIETRINYTNAVLPAVIEVVPPVSGTTKCITLSSDSGSVNSNLESFGDWTANLRSGACLPVGTIQKSSTAITVQSTVCGSVPLPPSLPAACTFSCTDGKVPDSTCTDCVAPPCSGGGMFESPLSAGYCSIGEILAKATDWILSLVSSIIVLVIIIGGLMYISSAGDEERLRASKNIIYYAIIGLGIILISAALINEVTTVLKG